MHVTAFITFVFNKLKLSSGREVNVQDKLTSNLDNEYTLLILTLNESSIYIT